MSKSEKITIILNIVLFSIIILCNVSLFSNKESINFYSIKRYYKDCTITELPSSIRINGSYPYFYKAVTAKNDTIIFSSMSNNMSDNKIINISNGDYIKYNYNIESEVYKEYNNFINYYHSLITIIMITNILYLILIVRTAVLFAGSHDYRFLDNTFNLIIFFTVLTIFIYDLINF